MKTRRLTGGRISPLRLREHVTKEVEKLAECIFRQKLSTHEISFDLEASDNYRMVEEYIIPIAEDECDSATVRQAVTIEPLRLSI